jgi:aminoglycoside 2'-N-acetyltransferase I
VVRVLDTESVAPLLVELRQLLTDAFDGDFSDDDWRHTLGGAHVVAFDGDAAVSHAAVVDRRIGVGEREFRAGYVEGVATRPDRQREGLAMAVMAEVSTVLRTRFELGVLSTSRHDFYQRGGWERWQGPTFVRTGGRFVRTEDEDDGIMVLRFGPSQDADLTAPISCDSRPGDDW